MNATPSQLAIERTIAAFEKKGLSIAGARLNADGSIDLLTPEAVTPLPSPQPTDSWVDLAGEPEAGRA